MQTAKIRSERGLISLAPMSWGRFLSDPIGILPGEAAPCLATLAKNSMLRYARSSTCARQKIDRPTLFSLGIGARTTRAPGLPLIRNRECPAVLTQLNPPLPLETTKGPGWAHFVIDYGPESALLWVVFMDADGACRMNGRTRVSSFAIRMKLPLAWVAKPSSRLFVPSSRANRLVPTSGGFFEWKAAGDRPHRK